MQTGIARTLNTITALPPFCRLALRFLHLYRSESRHFESLATRVSVLLATTAPPPSERGDDDFRTPLLGSTADGASTTDEEDAEMEPLEEMEPPKVAWPPRRVKELRYSAEALPHGAAGDDAGGHFDRSAWLDEPRVTAFFQGEKCLKTPGAAVAALAASAAEPAAWSSTERDALLPVSHGDASTAQGAVADAPLGMDPDFELGESLASRGASSALRRAHWLELKAFIAEEGSQARAALIFIVCMVVLYFC